MTIRAPLTILAAALALAGGLAAAQEPPRAETPAAAQATTSADPQAPSPAAAVTPADPQTPATAAPPAPPPPARTPGAMVLVAGGTFRAVERVGPYGDPAYFSVSPFYLDVTEVTASDYARCVKAGACKPAWTTPSVSGKSAEELRPWAPFCNWDRPDRADHPINCVDYVQAQRYCEAAGKRLPTGDELEWAARGGPAGTRHPWGDAPPEGRACWSGPGSDAPARKGTCPVASRPGGNAPSGVADLAGNVWEWTSTDDVVGADSRGRGGRPVKVVRGGGWADADPSSLTAGRRAKNLPQERAADLGFRCAKSR